MLITAGRILTGDADVTDGAVLVRDGIITAVGLRADIEAQAGSDEPRQDFPDSTLLPGLIDAHVHLVFDAGADPVATMQEASDEDLLEGMRKRADQLLATGVTTARDLGDRGGLALRLAQEIAAGTATGPRIIGAGAPVTPPGGHCWFLGGEVSNADEARALVRRNVADGAKVVKVMAGGGGLTKGGAPSWKSQFGADELAVVVEEAHQAGLKVAAHAHGTDAITDAVASGVDTIEHCTWMTEDGFDLREDVLAQIVEKGIYVCPAVSPHWRMLPRFFGEEKAAAMFALVQRMAEAGARLIAGTDAGVQRAGFDGIVGALGFYEHLGVSRDRILAMATTEAAAALGVGDQTGRIAPGYSADLLLVDGNPLEELSALSAVRAVFTNGRQHQAA
ncbi:MULTISPECIES: amidohydrolase family protein [unclassified Streptomyces]|uniref:amidohydrolase family protein n=1 Tax=unclassified Streptomyces TaxID=2593676 RepID=UPI000DC7B1EC|nr:MULTISPECIES: amidohydrolase family protein [unclassified Streptomyces]AWZ03583.1 amidohydrolase family protein [Streptomyces sp. ICC4]AWZ15153.1 amidohydrolase family protein [Streptomyces sp. ICC1]